MSRATSYHRERPMSHPAPSNAEPIRLTATQSHRESRNSLISGALELNLMPFGNEALIVCDVRMELLHRFVELPGQTSPTHPLHQRGNKSTVSRTGVPSCISPQRGA